MSYYYDCQGTFTVRQILNFPNRGKVTSKLVIVRTYTQIDGTLNREQVGHQWRDATALNNAMQTALDHLEWNAIVMSFVAVVLSLVLLLLPRVRQFEKRLVIDGVVIAVFCLFAVLLAVRLETSFIRQYLVQYPIAL